MNYLSVCSGIEAASVAWHPLGWSPVAFSEIEKFPSAVLAHHYPSVPNFGDMTKFRDWPDADIDVLVGGTPCQSFSVAGLRKGMADPRGNLALTYLAIADRYKPDWLVWENVPGVLSSSDGRDFGAFLGGLGELGYGFAYRVLDAQFVRVDGFGRAVPQRRRRVFVVGHLGDWRRAAAVLFERESLLWDSAPRRQAGERVAVDVAPSLVSSGRGVERTGETRGQDSVIAVSHDPACTLTAREYKGPLPEADLSTVIAHSLRADGFDASEDGTGRGTPLVPIDLRQASRGEKITNNRSKGSGGVPGHGIGELGDPAFTVSARGQAIAFAENSRAELRLCGGDGQVSAQLTTGGGKPGQGQPCIAFSAKDHGGDAQLDLSPTLRAGGFANSHANAGVMPAVAFQPRFARNGRGAPDEIASALTGEAGRTGKGDSAQCVAFSAMPMNSGKDFVVRETDVAQPIMAAGGPSLGNQGGDYIHHNWAVRRLTPMECERLQGFPDFYTAIPKAADGPRYKALGNSMAVNAMRWLGRRIEMVSSLGASA